MLDLPAPGAGGFTFTLWIDTQTLLPLKRLLAAEGAEGEPGAITEICTFNLKPTIDAGAFVLPK